MYINVRKFMRHFSLNGA